jgi:hypothetical protein
MMVNVQCHTTVNLPLRKKWVAQGTEGLVRPTPKLLLLVDFCIHHKQINEMNSVNVDK